MNAPSRQEPSVPSLLSVPPTEGPLVPTTRFVHAAAALGMVASAALLAEWLLRNPNGPGPAGLTNPAADTALAVGVAGLSLWLLCRDPPALVGRIAAGMVAILGMVTLARYLIAHDIALDWLLHRAWLVAPDTIDDRMALETALASALLGLGLLLLDRPRGGVFGQIASVFALLVALLGVVSGILHAETLRRLGQSPAVTLTAAATVFLMAAGALAARPYGPVIAPLLRDNAAGSLARRLLVSAVTVPILLGWIHMAAERAGVFGAEYGLALLVTSSVVTFVALIRWTTALAQGSEAQRSRAEAALRESESRFRGMFEQAAIGFALKGLDGRWLRVNPKLCKILGYSREELLARRFRDHAHPDDIHTDLDLVGPVLSGAMRTYALERRLMRKDGRTVWVRLTVSAARDDADAPRYLIVAIEDISERRHAAEQLRQHALRLETLCAIDRAILEQAAPDEVARAQVVHIAALVPCDLAQIILCDAHTGRRLTHATGSDAVDVSELTAEEVSSIEALAPHPALAVEDLNDRADHPPFLQHLRRAGMRSASVDRLGAGEHLLGIMTVCAAAPAAFTAEHRTVLREVANQLSIAIEQAHLRTELQQHAADLEQRVAERTAQLQAVNQELESFSYSVSHDLRAPLRRIDGFSQALLEDAPAALDEPMRHYLERIRSGTKEMTELIEALLGLAQVTRSEMRREPVDLGAVARDVIEELRRAHPDRQVDVVCTPSLLVQGDARLLRVLLSNLIGNAWKYTGRRERAHIELGVLERQGTRVIFVRDDGAGFDMQDAGKLFGAFQRLHSAAEFDGTGIGLATAQRIVRRHGGTIWAEGAPEQGATVYFTLDDELGRPRAPRSAGRARMR
ncbi:PAS domain S-box protein [bacterium]|nr:PAS domain S-box protein [bacterium]